MYPFSISREHPHTMLRGHAEGDFQGFQETPIGKASKTKASVLLLAGWRTQTQLQWWMCTALHLAKLLQQNQDTLIEQSVKYFNRMVTSEILAV